MLWRSRARDDEREKARKGVERFRIMVQGSSIAPPAGSSMDGRRLRSLVRGAASLFQHSRADQGDRPRSYSCVRLVARPTSHGRANTAQYRGAQPLARGPRRIVPGGRNRQGGVASACQSGATHQLPRAPAGACAARLAEARRPSAAVALTAHLAKAGSLFKIVQEIKHLMSTAHSGACSLPRRWRYASCRGHRRAHPSLRAARSPERLSLP